jgi:hypothetical protein
MPSEAQPHTDQRESAPAKVTTWTTAQAFCPRCAWSSTKKRGLNAKRDAQLAADRHNRQHGSLAHDEEEAR